MKVVTWQTLFSRLPAIAYLTVGAVLATTTDPYVPCSVVLFLIGGFALLPHHPPASIDRRIVALEAEVAELRSLKSGSRPGPVEPNN